MKTMALILGVLALGSGASFLAYRDHEAKAKRISRVEEFFSNVCTSAAVSSASDMQSQIESARDCNYGNRSLAADLSSKSDGQLIDGLVHFCLSRGGVSQGDRIDQRLAAINGKITTDTDVCRNRVREAFPEL